MTESDVKALLRARLSRWEERYTAEEFTFNVKNSSPSVTDYAHFLRRHDPADPTPFSGIATVLVTNEPVLT